MVLFANVTRAESAWSVFCMSLSFKVLQQNNALTNCLCISLVKSPIKSWFLTNAVSHRSVKVTSINGTQAYRSLSNISLTTHTKTFYLLNISLSKNKLKIALEWKWFLGELLIFIVDPQLITAHSSTIRLNRQPIIVVIELNSGGITNTLLTPMSLYFTVKKIQASLFCKKDGA